jgi:hypothetical protein
VPNDFIVASMPSLLIFCTSSIFFIMIVYLHPAAWGEHYEVYLPGLCAAQPPA